MLRTTYFNIEAVNRSLKEYHGKFNFLSLPESVNDYKSFCNSVPVLHDDELERLTREVIKRRFSKNCNFNISSATSGNHKFLAQRIWRTVTPDSYPHQLVRLIKMQKIFNEDDTVANLFSAGGMSTLYEGCSRILEACGATILPIGRLDAYPSLKETFIKCINDTSTNTLFGTPNSILQCLKLASKQNISLKINKLVFTGEMFNGYKRAYAQSALPAAKIYGLYGHSETGFVGINTPSCHDDLYHLLSDHFFFELTEKDELLITDLTIPLVPLFRYYVGDSGNFNINQCKCGNLMPSIELRGRCDKKFNYSGNLVSCNRIMKLVKQIINLDTDIQIQLTTKQDAVDLLDIVVDVDFAYLNNVKKNLIKELTCLEEISEGINKGIGELNILPREYLIYSDRQKLPPIFDKRNMI